jgi:hypothetical protein
VGIGTWVPVNKLDLNGAMAIGSYSGVNAAPSNGLLVQGNVGIGTFSNSYPLMVFNSVTGQATLLTLHNNQGATNNTADIDFGTQSGSGAVTTTNQRIGTQRTNLVSSGDGDIYFSTEGSGSLTEKMRILSTGNVGIGTRNPFGGKLIVSGGNVGIGSLAPGQALDVQGTVRATNFIGSGAGLTGVSSQWTTTNTNDVYLPTQGNVGIGTSITTAGAALTVMNGNVGIGTWVPAQNLQVIGNIGIGTATGTGSGQLLVPNGTSSSPSYSFSNATNMGLYAVSNTALDITIGGTRTTEFQSELMTFAQNQIKMDNAQTSTNFDTISVWNGAAYIPYIEMSDQSATSEQVLFPNGNVGIGSLNPGQLLDVQGSVRILGGGTIGIGTALTGTSALTVMNGNVGIGTWVPGTKLEVSGQELVGLVNTPTPFLTFNNSGNNYASFYNISLNGTTGGIALGGSATILGQPTILSMFWNVNSGNVGIGTFAPNGKLIVASGNVGLGSLTPGTALDVTGTIRMSTGSGGTLIFPDGTSQSTAATGGASGWTLGASNVGISTTNNVGIGTNLTTTAGLTVMNGNVGIGTWVPAVPLQIISTINSGTVAGIEIDDISSQNTTGGGQIRVGKWNTSSAMTSGNRLGTIAFAGSPSAGTGPYAGAEISAYADGSTWTISSIPSYLAFETAPTGSTTRSERMRIDNQGNIGIGTTITQNAGLSIMNGNVGIGTWVPLGTLQVGPSSGHPIVIDSGGNLGIGTWINPNGGDLFISHIAGSTAIGAISFQQGTTAGAAWVGSATGAFNGVLSSDMGIRGNSNIYLGNTSTPALTIDANNNVGIGTNIPSQAFSIVGNVGIGTGKNSPYVTTAPPSGGLIVQGNVGIGSLAPGKTLDVTGTVRATAFVGDGSGLTGLPATGGWTLGASNVGISTTNNVGIGTNLTTTAGLSVMNGNVGIGTWVPSKQLQISSTSPFINLQSPGNGLNGFGGILFSGNTNAQSSLWTINNQIASLFEVENSNAKSVFVVDRSGNVGIGTLLPMEKLTVNGSVGIGTTSTDSFIMNAAPNGGMIVEGNVGIGTWLPSRILEIAPRNNVTATLGLDSTSGSGSEIDFGQSNYSTEAQIRWNGSVSNALEIDTNGSSRMLIDNTGNIGIGTVITGNAGLSIMNGNVGIGTWKPDYLFQVGPGTGYVGTPLFYVDSSGNAKAQGNLSSITGYGLFQNVHVGDGNFGNSTLHSSGGGNLNLQNVASDSFSFTSITNSTTSPVFLFNALPSGVIDLFQIQNNGTPKLDMDNNGNIGIGTVTPGSKLDVRGTVTVLGGGTVGIGTSLTSTSALTVMNGNVGIGTWVPSQKMTVKGGSVAVIEKQATTAATVSVDWSQGNQQYVTLNQTGHTVNFSNYVSGQAMRLIVCQDGSGGRTVTTWDATIVWSGGSAPTLTATASQCDVLSFVTTGAKGSQKVFGSIINNF